MIGTDTVWQHTYQTGPPGVMGRLLKQDESLTGLGTKRQVEEFRIHPNIIKELPTGQAVVILKIPRASARIIRVIPWSPLRSGNAN